MPKEENEKPVEKANETKPDIATVKEKSYQLNKPILTGAIVVIIILLIILGFSMFRFWHANGYYNNDNGWIMRGRNMTFYSNEMPHMGSSIYIQSTSSNGNSSSTSVIASGVVVSVKGNSFDIAGNGTKTTINTSGSTAWNTTDKKVTVNDSVYVAGTKSGNAINATSVQITNF